MENKNINGLAIFAIALVIIALVIIVLFSAGKADAVDTRMKRLEQQIAPLLPTPTAVPTPTPLPHHFVKITKDGKFTGCFLTYTVDSAGDITVDGEFKCMGR